MKWIKASERLPDNNGYNYFVKATADHAGYLWNATAIFKDNNWHFLFAQQSTRVIEWLDESPPVKTAEEVLNEFIEKHLMVFMDKTADIFIELNIEKMFGSLQMASVEHFLKTGKVNGSLRENIKRMMVNFASKWHKTAYKVWHENSENHIPQCSHRSNVCMVCNKTIEEHFSPNSNNLKTTI